MLEILWPEHRLAKCGHRALRQKLLRHPTERLIGASNFVATFPVISADFQSHNSEHVARRKTLSVQYFRQHKQDKTCWGSI